MEKKERLLSLDALRGFDMWFITGGAGVVTGLAAAFGAPDCAIAKHMSHVVWEGFRHHDTIFPMFLFLAGVSWPFSLSSQLAKGRSLAAIHLKVLSRAATLFFFGLLLGGLLKFSPTFRIPSVLGFIGISWAIGALIYLHVKNTAARIGVVAALLFGYWALLRFVAAPGSPALCDTYSLECNIVSWLDRTVMSNYIYKKGAYDPESLFAVAGGVATAMTGMLAGSLLKGSFLTPAKKALTLALAGAGFLALDALFVFAMGDKIIKSLWTPSFVLSAAAYSILMLSLFYYVIDVLGWRRWTLYFSVIGMNSITVYMAMNIIGFSRARSFLFAGLRDFIGGPWGEVVYRCGMLVVVWAFLYFLYRKKIFLKV